MVLCGLPLSLVATDAMAMVYWTVARTPDGKFDAAPHGIFSSLKNEEGGGETKESHPRRVAKQAFWYLFAFYLTWTFPTELLSGSTKVLTEISVSGAPVFSVEIKKVWDTGTLTNGVYGQVCDQLCEMQAKGHPNPFGALTCFDETHILWLDNDSTKGVLNRLEDQEYGTDRLKRIVSGLFLVHTRMLRLTQTPLLPATSNLCNRPPNLQSKRSKPPMPSFRKMASLRLQRAT
jgi:hypothetical protein